MLRDAVTGGRKKRKYRWGGLNRMNEEWNGNKLFVFLSFFSKKRKKEKRSGKRKERRKEKRMNE